MAKRLINPKTITSHVHEDATRLNIPTAELQPMMKEEHQTICYHTS